MTLRSSFEEALFRKQQVTFPPHVSFRGEVRRTDGSDLRDEELDLLKWIITPIAQATEKIVFPDPSQTKLGRSTVSPKTVINFSGMPNASARVSGEGELEIHLGLLFALHSLFTTFGLVNRLIKGSQSSFSDLENFKPPHEVITELDQLMDAWDKSSKSGWTQSILPRGIAPTPVDKDSLMHSEMMYRGLTYIVVGHEITHWLETIYKDAEWMRKMTEVKAHLSTWLAEEKLMVPPHVVDNARQLLKEPDVLDAWVREINADCGALDFSYASNTLGGMYKSREALMRIYIQMALFFSILRLFEAYAQATGHEINVITHPPASIRRAVFCHIQAKRYHMSEEDFLLHQFGAGAAVSFIMDAIIGDYMNVLYSRVGKR
ncbi:MAG: hypothetical protein ABR985_09430 [Methanotrichaceae archaeon]